jgi:hypothetical protein
MFGSYILGFVGWTLQLGSLFFVLCGLIMLGGHTDGSWLAFAIAFAMIFVGGYLKYLSKQSVRVRS